MSDEVAMLETLMHEWSRGEFWHASAYADDVVFVVSGPDAAEYRGIGQLTSAWRAFLEAWEDFRIEPDRVVRGHDDDVYVVLQRLKGRGQGSGVAIEAEVAGLVHMRGGRIARFEMFWDQSAALAAAGASA